MKRSLFLILYGCILLVLSGCPKSSTVSPGSGSETRMKSAETCLETAKKVENTDPSYANLLACKALYYAQVENRPLLKVKAQLQIASVFVTRTRYAEAMKIALQAREQAEKLNSKPELAVYYEIAGKIKTATGDYNQSLEDLFVALDYFDRLRDINGRGRAQNAIGTVYYWEKDYKKAMNYYIHALAISILTRDSVLMARSINNMGVIFMTRQDNKNALLNYKKALILNQKTGQLSRVGGNLMNLGIIYQRLRRNEESAQSYQKALSIFRRFDNYSNLALCYMNMGFSYEGEGKQDSCLISMQKAYNMAKQYGFKGVELETASKLQDLFRERKQIDSAFKYSIVKEKVKDSIEREKSATRLSIAEFQYHYEKKNSEQKLRQQRQDFFTVVVLLILLALVIIAFLIISRQRQKTKAIALEKKTLSDELEFKNKELTLNVMNLLKRNEFIIDTSRRLLDIKPDQQPEKVKEEVFKIAKSLQDETDKETWEEFDLRFKQVHSGYYDRLLAQFAELTPNELKMCGLLRLNLTTKEISELTGQRRETIEMARFRLRKHLGINDPQVNLVTFLAKI